MRLLIENQPDVDREPEVTLSLRKDETTGRVYLIVTTDIGEEFTVAEVRPDGVARRKGTHGGSPIKWFKYRSEVSRRI